MSAKDKMTNLGVKALAAGIGASTGATAAAQYVKPVYENIIDPSKTIRNNDGTVSHGILSQVVTNQGTINGVTGAAAVIGAVGLGAAAHWLLSKNQNGKK